MGCSMYRLRAIGPLYCVGQRINKKDERFHVVHHIAGTYRLQAVYNNFFVSFVIEISSAILSLKYLTLKML